MSVATTPKPHSPFASLFWKESRQLLPFFYAMLLLGGLFQLLIAFVVTGMPNSTSETWFVCVGLIGGFSALFAVAAASTLFATEKEDGTFQNLQLLPITSKQVYNPKLAAAATLSCLFLLITLGIAAVCYTVADVPAPQQTSTTSGSWVVLYLQVFGLATVEFFLWGWLLSVLISRPLNAAIISILMASLTIQLAIFCTGEQYLDFMSPAPYVMAWKFRMIFALVVLAIAWKYSVNWLNGGVDSKATRLDRQGSNSLFVAALARPATWSIRGLRQSLPQLSRLAWQAVRQSWKTVAIAVVATLAVGISASLLNIALLFITIPLLTTAAGFAGMAAFSADQRQVNNNFLAVRGVSSFKIWLSRVLPWTLGIVALFAVAYFLFLSIISQFKIMELAEFASFLSLPAKSIEEHPILEGMAISYIVGQLVFWGALSSLLCFAAGQFASLVLRRQILAFILTALLCLFLVSWLILIAFGAVPIWWSVLPLLGVMLLGGWMALKANLNEASLLRRSIIPTATVATVTAVVIFLTWQYRAHQIPAVALNFQTEVADQQVIDEIDQRFNQVLSNVEFSEEVSSLRGIYPKLLEPSLLDDQSNFGDEPPSLPGIDRSFINQGKPSEQIINQLALNLQIWRERIQRGEEIRIDTLTEIVDRFLDEHDPAIAELHSAIEFAWRHREQLDRIPAGFPYTKKGANPLIVRARSVLELLELSLLREIHRNDAAAAWPHLKAMSQFSRLLAYDQAHWYARSLTYFDEWAVCNNQTPELLNEALQIVLKEFLPLPEQRILEYQCNALLRKNSNYEHEFDAIGIDLTSVVWNLPCERQRTERLIRLHGRNQLQQFKECDWRLPDLDKNETKWPVPPNPKNSSHMRQEFSSLGERESNWSRTSALPRMSRNHSYFRELYSDSLAVINRRYDEAYFIQWRCMQALQLYLVRHQLINKTLPVDLGKYTYLMMPLEYSWAYRIHQAPAIDPYTPPRLSKSLRYYPNGIENWFLPNIDSQVPYLPPGTPFISNRTPGFLVDEYWLPNNPESDTGTKPFSYKDGKFVGWKTAMLPKSTGTGKTLEFEAEAMLMPLAKIDITQSPADSIPKEVQEAIDWRNERIHRNHLKSK